MTGFELHQWVSIWIAGPRRNRPNRTWCDVRRLLHALEDWEVDDLTPDALVAITTAPLPALKTGLSNLFYKAAGGDLHNRFRGVPLPRDHHDRVLGHYIQVQDDNGLHVHDTDPRINLFLVLTDEEINEIQHYPVVVWNKLVGR